MYVKLYRRKRSRHAYVTLGRDPEIRCNVMSSACRWENGLVPKRNPKSQSR